VCFPLTDPQKLTFNPALIYDCLVTSETRTNYKPEKIQTNRQRAMYFSHRSLHSLRLNFIRLIFISPQCNLIFRLSCRLSNSPTKSYLFFSSYLLIERRSMFPNLSLVMEFLGNALTNFIFEKLLLHEALMVTGRVTSTSNNQRQLFK